MIRLHSIPPRPALHRSNAPTILRSNGTTIQRFTPPTFPEVRP